MWIRLNIRALIGRAKAAVSLVLKAWTDRQNLPAVVPGDAAGFWSAVAPVRTILPGSGCGMGAMEAQYGDRLKQQPKPQSMNSQLVGRHGDGSPPPSHPPLEKILMQGNRKSGRAGPGTGVVDPFEGSARHSCSGAGLCMSFRGPQTPEDSGEEERGPRGCGVPQFPSPFLLLPPRLEDRG
ncbi:hypothetical protein NDU88_005194 [Pleurodeles waltl]|uniref:Uncharacterized protein n=1 Tax=Pleurodeles waltl TaxID=8319 RepID=A0AAV7WXJ7_PLEWA|nr:hypothetical protein NDU88_005194 [Pleurodeles waltl]